MHPWNIRGNPYDHWSNSTPNVRIGTPNIRSCLKSNFDLLCTSFSVIHFNLLVCGDSSNEQDILFSQMILGTLVLKCWMGSLFCPNMSCREYKIQGVSGRVVYPILMDAPRVSNSWHVQVVRWYVWAYQAQSYRNLDGSEQPRRVSGRRHLKALVFYLKTCFETFLVWENCGNTESFFLGFL